MFISFGFIAGFNVGIEYVEDDSTHYVMINVGIMCILVEKFKKTS